MAKVSKVVEDAYNEVFAAPTFSAGTVLRLTISMFGKNPLLYLGLASIACIPGITIRQFATTRDGMLIDALASGMFSVIFVGAIAYGVYRGLIGERAGIGEALRRGLSRYVSLFGLSLIGGVFCICIIRTGEFLGVVGVLVALVVLCYCLCVYAVTTPACVVERLGALQSMLRSAVLTQGRRGSIFGLLFLWMLCWIIATIPFYFIFYSPFPDRDPVFFRLTGFQIAMHVIDVIMMALFHVGESVLYYQLRSSREGVSVSELARVFE